jgi:hypothetical protein
MNDRRNEAEETESTRYFTLHRADNDKCIGVYREPEAGDVFYLIQQINDESGGEIPSILARPISQSDYETLRKRHRELLLERGSL